MAPRVRALQRIRSPSGELQRELSPREQQEDKAGFGILGKEKSGQSWPSWVCLFRPSGGCQAPSHGMNWDSPVTCAERGAPAPRERPTDVTINGRHRARKALLPCSPSADIPQSLSTECAEVQPAPATARASLGTTELLGG